MDNNPLFSQLVERWADDELYFGKCLFPAHFRWESPKFHIAILRDAKTHQWFAIAAPRGHAKTTLLVFLYPAHKLIFKRKRFIVIVSNTFTKAAQQLSNIKLEFRSNEMIKQFFPGLEWERDAEGDSILLHPDGFRTRVLCKGYDQIPSIRGEKFGPYRPDLIIGDDMEDDEMVKSGERRKKLRDDIDRALMPAGDPKDCQFLFIGTVLHDDAFINHLLDKEEYKEFYKVKYQAHIRPDEPDEEALWSEVWDLEKLKALRRDKPDTYAKEMQNDPVSGENYKFSIKDFRKWEQTNKDYICFNDRNEIIKRGSLKDCTPAIACDLAWSEKRSADFSVLMPGLLTPDSDLLLPPYIHKRGLKPAMLAEYLFQMVDMLEKMTGRNCPVGFEKSMLENVQQFLLKQEMKARNKFLTIKELKWDADKNSRIELRLQPRYAQHVIYHSSGMGELEYQLCRFPSGKHDDLPDAEQGLVQMLKYAATPAKETTQGEDHFNWWRRQAINAKLPKNKKVGNFQTKKKQFTVIPAKSSWK